MISESEYPDFDEAPKELRHLYNGCGPLVQWSVLRYFEIQASASDILKSCHYRSDYGTYTIGLACGLREFGLKVAFYSDSDNAIAPAEEPQFDLGRELGVVMSKAISLETILASISSRSVQIVYYVDSEVEHFSPLLGMKEGHLVLAHTDLPRLTMAEFAARWNNEQLCRQSVIVSR